MTKELTKEERAKFFRLSAACANPDQVKRLTTRLKLNKFVIEHGKDACQAAWDAAIANAVKKLTKREQNAILRRIMQ